MDVRTIALRGAAVGLLLAFYCPPAGAARQASDEERSAIVSEFGGTPRCYGPLQPEQVSVSDVDPNYAATIAAPDCEYEWIVSELQSGQWTAVAFGNVFGSCRLVVEQGVARDLDICAADQSCRSSAEPRGTRKALLRAVGGRGVRGPIGRLRYGVCGGERWALAKFSYPMVGTTDQPTLLRRRGGRWKVMGEAGGSPLCELAYGYEGSGGPVPFEMIDAWKIDPDPCA